MSATVVVGQLISPDGSNVRSYFSHDPRHMWSPIRHQVWVIDPNQVRDVQGSEIPLRAAHGTPPIGQITHLERRQVDGSIWAAGTIDEDIRPLPDRDYFLSVEATFDEGTGADVEITGAALCQRSAMTGLRPVTFIRDGLDVGSGRRVDGFPRRLLERSRNHHRRDGRLTVHDEQLDLDLDRYDRLDANQRHIVRSELTDAWLNQPLRYRPSKILRVH